MRITQSMIAASTLSNINNSYSNMEKYQNQVSSGKKVTKPSDDPIAATNGMYYTSVLNSIDQYKRNVTTLQTWNDNSENGISQASSDLSRIRDLVVQVTNGTYNSDDLKTVSAEVGQINQDLVNTANTQVAGKYIYHGTDVTNPPATLNSDGSVTVAANLDDPKINNFNVEVSQGLSIRANVNPANTFNKELFDVVGSIQNALQNNDQSGLSDMLTKLDNVTNSLSAERSDLGARSNQIDMVSSRLDQQKTTATQGLTNNIDVDIESAIVNMTTQQNAYKAALGVGAQIIQPSLLDYLK